ncbi:MAG: aminotransferase class I/II-fold pyridoxal phosphate-dependent enzyme [Acidimicrobiales bacterium]
MTDGFVPPPYPHDRLAAVVTVAGRHRGGAVDLSIGTPFDPPMAAVVEALAGSDSERGYPPSIGTPAYREAASRWLARRFGIDLGADDLAATVGTKEFVAGLPHWLRLRSPQRDTVLHPALAYPTYAMGAQLAGARAVPVPMHADWSIDLDAIDPDDAQRALCLWVNTPGNPAGGLDDLEAAVEWGRRSGVPVVSDECYIEFTWRGDPRSVLHHGLDGVLAVHSLSKRSNLAGTRAGFYAGDTDLVQYLREVRKHAGFMVPGPVQAAACVAFDDDQHVDAQRELYHQRLAVGAELLAAAGLDVDLPGGGFYLWAAAPEGDAWGLTRQLAERVGFIVSPGDFDGPAGPGHVRLAMVQPVERLRVAIDRLRS